jgi:uncharacterized protein
MEEILSSIRRIIADEDKEDQRHGADREDADAADADLDEPDDGVLDLTHVVQEDGEVLDLDERTAPAASEPEPARAEAAADASPAANGAAPDGAVQDPAEPGAERQAEPDGEPAAGPPIEPDGGQDAARDGEEEAEELELQPIEAAAPPADPQPQPPVQEAETPVENRDSKPDALISDPAASASTQAFASLAKEVAPKDDEPLPGSGQTVEQLVAEMMRPMLKEWLDSNLPALVERVVQDEISKLRKRAELD